MCICKEKSVIQEYTKFSQDYKQNINANNNQISLIVTYASVYNKHTGSANKFLLP